MTKHVLNLKRFSGKRKAQQVPAVVTEAYAAAQAAAARKSAAPRVRESEKKLPSSFFSRTRFSLKDQVFLAKRLSFLMSSGVSVVEALHVLRDQAKSRGHQRVLGEIARDVSSGQALSKSFAKHPGLMSDFGVHIIRIGESSGTLSQNLVYLADELTKKHALRRKVLGTLVYPIFITVATLGITGLLTVYIFPKIMPIFTSLHVPLPWTTRALIWVSAFLRGWGILSVVGFAALIFGLLVAHKKIGTIRYGGDWLLLRLPVAGRLARAYNLANFCRTLGLLLKSGVRVNEAVQVTAETTKNAVYKASYFTIAESTVRGEPISRGLAARRDIFPPILSHMVNIGETTGNLTPTLVYLSELYEGDVDELTKGLSSAIEPILMIMMGIIVGLIAVSVITPIYEITQHLNPKGN